MTPLPQSAAASLPFAASELTVDGMVRERAKAYPQRIALVQDDRRIAYGELQSRVDRLCHALLQMSVGRRDRIAVLSENRVEFVETMLAAAALGAIVACQNWRQTDDELSHCMQLVEPCLVLVSPRYAHRLGTVAHGAREVIAFGDEYERLLARAKDTCFESRSRPEDELLILYTSGTTGYPKGAAISHRAEIGRAMIAMADSQLFSGMGTISWSPLSRRSPRRRRKP